MSTNTDNQTSIYAEGVHTVPLDRVWVREGFNPREQRDDRAFAATAASVADAGVLTPILVTPETPEDAAADDVRSLRVVAGEGRYLAAVQSGHETIPVSVREVDTATGGLEWALAENVVREDMDVVSIAKGWRRLKDAGWSFKQIAQRFGISPKLVTERMRILQIPEALHPSIADGTIPLSAIRPLALAAAAHGRLPGALHALATSHIRGWSEIVEDPARALTHYSEFRPDDAYPVGQYYGPRLDALDLSDDARAAAAEISALRGEVVTSFGFDTEAVDQAAAMGCLYNPADRFSLIIGRDVASQLVGDSLLRAVEYEREIYAKRKGEDAPAPSSLEEREAVDKEERRQQREEDKEAQRKAVAFNDALGAEVSRHLARIDPTEPKVLQLLAMVNLHGNLDDIAGRGARYTLPGWVGVDERKSGNRPVFLGRLEATKKATAYLAAASDPAEIAGRLVTLIALAHYADDRAVARSNRIWWQMPMNRSPWGSYPVDLLHDICGAVLPDAVTAHRHQERAEERAAEAEEERETAEAKVRVDAAVERAADLTPEERQAALKDVARAYGPTYYGGESARLAALLKEAAMPAPAPTSDEEPAADVA